MTTTPDRALTRPPRVALVMMAIGDLSGSGGAERQFGQLHEYLQRTNPGRVVLVTDQASQQRLRDAGRLHGDDGVVALGLGRRVAHSKIGIVRLTVALLLETVGRGWDVVHICLPTPSYVPFAALLTALPHAWRPRVAITVIDCTVAPNLATNTPADLYEQQVMDAHRLYFKWTRLDAVYSWYQSFVDAARSLRLVPDRTTVIPARHCFTDPGRFQPHTAKENVVIFAGRMSTQKRPLLFVDAVASLRRRHAALVDGWRFEMYGGGVLETEVRARIAELRLGDVMTVMRAPDLAPVFARTRVFVSTQAFENFTSLAMLEAMAAGNAVIAEDIGQTREFVKPGENGFLVSPASADGFADAIAEYIRRPELSAPMARVSRALTTEVHTIENFAADIISFWSRLARE